MNLKTMFNVSIYLMFFNLMVTCLRANNYNSTRPAHRVKSRLNTKSATTTNTKIIKYKKNRELSNINNKNYNTVNLFTKSDNLIVQSFVKNLKKLKGDWSQNGLQRIIRLNSECSEKYISLRNSNIRADIPISEAFKDPYTLIEQQIYRKLMTLKSKYTNKYLCYNYVTKNFVLKSLNNIDKYCVFFYSVKSLNKYTFSIGSNKTINLTFNKYGGLINDVSQARVCRNKSISFHLHTKSTDNLDQFRRKTNLMMNKPGHKNVSFKNENINFNYSQMISRPKLNVKSKNGYYDVNTTREYKIYLFKTNKRIPLKSNLIKKTKNIKELKQK